MESIVVFQWLKNEDQFEIYLLKNFPRLTLFRIYLCITVSGVARVHYFWGSKVITLATDATRLLTVIKSRIEKNAPSHPQKIVDRVGVHKKSMITFRFIFLVNMLIIIGHNVNVLFILIVKIQRWLCLRINEQFN